MWLFKQKPEYLDALVKYHSCTSGLGKNYVEPRKVNAAAASCRRRFGQGSAICLAWKGWCQGCPVAGVKIRCMLNADVGLTVRFARVTSGSGWSLEDSGDDG